ncbi:hypothetical protein TWF106_006237 [Orbilia oligospora]|uniref:Uncharacterized protein n=1 Tax=Orbilia oligospora TaxID=2813651 RepID=A0A6G1MBK5_ORBOL|nr:hypothetical protein TWF106_006237 [Orbilia oligospora]KAF3230797.1 hypothetical protein TWF191_008637 [Orbilia oligospora]KAF3250295.1 hypothetical protein TWF192_005317 [Orbilia oligospora]
MCNLLKKLSASCFCSADADSNSSESEVENTIILPHRRPAEPPKGILKNPAVGATEASGNGARAVGDKAAVKSAQKPNSHSKNPRVFRPDLDNPPKDPYHRSGGDDESTLIIDPGSNFPASSAPAPEDSEDSENESSIGNILPEDLAGGHPLPIPSSNPKQFPKQLPAAGEELPLQAPPQHQQLAPIVRPNTTTSPDATQSPAGAEPLTLPRANSHRSRHRSRPRNPRGPPNRHAPSTIDNDDEGGHHSLPRDTRRDCLMFLTREQASELYPGVDLVTSDDLAEYLRMLGVSVGPETEME